MISRSNKIGVLIAVMFGIVLSFNATVEAKSSQFDGEGIAIINSQNTNISFVDLDIIKGSARIEAYIKTDAGSKTEMRVFLQKLNKNTGMWTTIKTWEKSSMTSSTTLSTSFNLPSKGSYRCRMTGTVTKNGKTDNISDTSKTKTY